MTKEKNGINKYFSRLIAHIQQKFRNFSVWWCSQLGFQSIPSVHMFPDVNAGFIPIRSNFISLSLQCWIC